MNVRNTLMTVGMAAALGMSSIALVAAEKSPARGEGRPAPPTAEVQSARTAARALETAFIDVADRVGPSVVSIRVEADVGGGREVDLRRFFGLPREFFGDPEGGDPGGQDGPSGRPGRRAPGRFSPVEPRGGSGVIVSESGDIVTNNHVVEGAKDIKVILADDREFPAVVKGRDPESDIALIHIDARGLPAAKWAAKDAIRVGGWAVAVGAPFGLERTVTIGHVSGLGRQIGIRDIAFQDFIQTDASINPGNSGGPLVNLDGEVMGINTAILGMGTGVGFAVPSHIARNVAEQLLADGKVSRPYLGVQVKDLTADEAEALGIPTRHGAMVQQVVKDTPAAKAGIATSDVIVSVGSEDVKSAQELVNTVARHRIGEKVDVVLYRDGKQKTLTLVTDKRPGAEQIAEATDTGHENGQLGVELQGTTPDVNRSLGREPGAAGVVVRSVAPYSPAQRAGLEPGDVILKVGGQDVKSPADVGRLVRESTRSAVGMLVERDGATLFLAVRKVADDKAE